MPEDHCVEDGGVRQKEPAKGMEEDSIPLETYRSAHQQYGTECAAVTQSRVAGRGGGNPSYKRYTKSKGPASVCRNHRDVSVAET